MIKAITTVIGILILVLIPVIQLRADVAPLRDPRGVTLDSKEKASEQIEMKAEEVYLSLSSDKMKVKAIFHMYNTDAELKIIEGFPIGQYPDALNDFTVTCRGKKIKTEIINLNEGVKSEYGKVYPEYWIRWENTYPAKSQQDMEVTYYVRPEENWGRPPKDNPKEKDCILRTGYILHTGADWKGFIGKAIIELTFEDGLSFLNVSSISRADAAVIQKNKIIWTFEQLEPTRDDNIKFHSLKDYPSFFEEYKNSKKPDEKSELESYAKLHDRKTYWESVNESLKEYRTDKNGDITVVGGNSSYDFQYRIVSIFRESLKYAGNEEGAIKALSASINILEKLIDAGTEDKVFEIFNGKKKPIKFNRRVLIDNGRSLSPADYMNSAVKPNQTNEDIEERLKKAEDKIRLDIKKANKTIEAKKAY